MEARSQGLLTSFYAPGAWNLETARTFCRNLALSHYENFLVASVFLPRRLKQHFYNVYAYCRVSDDLADEAGSPAVALELLWRWQQELRDCYRGQTRHPVFIALSDTIASFDIPMEPFTHLLEAFVQDQSRTRYETFEQLLGYCRYSANPVGRLVLYLCGYRDEERQQLSDRTCTALQLANHWQDVARDLIQSDRVYLPREDMERFGYGEGDLRAQACDERFAALMRLEVGRDRNLFYEGLRLRQLVDPRLSMEIELFGRCGLEVLRRIEAAQYDVFRRRPVLSPWDRVKIITDCCLRNGFDRLLHNLHKPGRFLSGLRRHRTRQ
jgi:squalene synthase HpnC